MRQPLMGLALATAALGAVSSSLSQAKAIESQTVAIQFEGMVGESPFACGETYRLGERGTPVSAMDFRFYVSDVALIDTDGNEVPLVLQQDGKWQHQNVALLDFEDKSGSCTNGTPEVRKQVVGSVPAGDYTGVKFSLGVPFGLNHLDSTLAPSPLNLTSLWWNWNAGYKFVRIDMMPMMDMAMPSGEDLLQRRKGGHGAHGENKLEAGGEHGDGHSGGHGGGHGNEHGGGHSSGHGAGGHGAGGHDEGTQAFAFHLGSIGCQTDTAEAPVVCGIPNRPEIVLDNFDPAEGTIVADLAALFAQTNLAENQENTPGGCMSSPADGDCAGLMQSLGLPFNQQPVAEQQFFGVK